MGALSMNDKVILSIIIPTKNRTEYLRGCLGFVKKTKRNDYEVIIQDNSDNPTIVREIVDSFHCELIKYYYCGERLSQT